MAAKAPPRSWTASVCTAAMVRGTHSFKIEGHSLYSSSYSGSTSICSATFAVGGHEWRIRYYPDGFGERMAQAPRYVSVFLQLVSEHTGVVPVVYSFCLVNLGTGLRSAVCSRANFGRTNWSHGIIDFMKKKELEETYLHHDCIMIECNVSVLKQSLVGAPADLTSKAIRVPPSDLPDSLVKFLEAEEEVDVAFEVKGEVFRAHRILLAMRSPVFKAELYGPMRNKGTMGEESIRVEDMEPLAFKTLLRFIYTDKLPAMGELEDEDLVRHLLVAADRYAMERMKLMCESILCKKLNAQNVAATLALADQHHCTKLKDACVAYMKSPDNIDRVMASKGYQHLKRKCPLVFIDVWEQVAKSHKI